MSVRAAGEILFEIEGTIGLSAEIGGQIAKEVFEVAPIPATKTILDMAFIYKEIDRNETKSRQNVSTSWHTVAIVAIFDDGFAVYFIITAIRYTTVRTRTHSHVDTMLDTNKLRTLPCFG